MTSPLARFNRASETAALAALREVCASSAWGRALLARRPYASLDELLAAGEDATARLTESDLAEAVAGHPPIGRATPGDPVSGREQGGMAVASEELRADILELNLEYQEKFGQVFLICAAGAPAEQLRDAMKARLGNSPAEERAIARRELGKINRSRLTRLAAPCPATVSTHVLDTSLGLPAEGVSVALSSAAPPQGAAWTELGGSVTDGDGRCGSLPALPDDTTRVRLVFDTGAYLASSARAEARAEAQAEARADAQQDAPALPRSGAFFPEVTVVFAVTPGEHHHVPLLLNPFGYSVYRGS